MTQQDSTSQNSNWKTRIYIIGTLIGTALGFFSAYLFAQEAEADTDGEEDPEIQPVALLGVALSVITVVRQIAESGRKKKDKKK